MVFIKQVYHDARSREYDKCLILMLCTPVWYCEVPCSNTGQRLDILSLDLGVFLTFIHFVTYTLVTPQLAWVYYDVTGSGVCP